MPTLTPEAKSQLSRTIRQLRERLLTDLRDAAESAYRMAVPVSKAGLGEAERIRRQRLEAWLDEQARADRGKQESLDDARERHRLAAEKLAGATLLNRLVVVKHMEALGMLRPAVVTGGWNSQGYRQFRDFARALAGGESEGYATLLRLVFDELAIDLPGLFGEVGVSGLLPVPPATLRAVVEALDDPGLESAWTDDTTLGWVYQYWNDPEREALDAKLHAGGKVEPHEIASKTQMFTERYMVEWLLHNSLGQMWLAMCKRHGWTPAVEADGTLDRLEERRKDWRAKREAGEVALDELMPIETAAEERWKYWVPQPMPEDSVEKAPESVRELKILDPACGSGHFLVIAFDLLVALYREEARHRGEEWEDREIVESIVENNLHGIDIDPWAVQIAAAALFLKMRQACREAHPRRLNLVASNLRLASLQDDDPALVELRRTIREETGIPESLTDEIIHALQGADHLGSLLKVDAAVEEAIRRHDEESRRRYEEAAQGDLFRDSEPRQELIDFDEARQSVLDRLEEFLSRQTGGDDLGLRLRGEQLAAGIRFVRLLREGSYDLVVGNPPYQGTSKMAEGRYVKKHYPRGKADLYAAFLERGLQLVRSGGVSALLTMRNWMFIKQYTQIRQYLLESFDLRLLGDVDRGAFDEVPNEVLSTVMSVFRRASTDDTLAIAIQPTSVDDRSYDRQRTKRKRAAVLAQVGR
ncbi:MAG: BREX-6 system adenine-specific DNA-methyltransferase PglX, partial [Thermoanaerobaculia bacterium]